jgi:TonB family protein
MRLARPSRLILIALGPGALTAFAQRPSTPDSTRCDSIVARAQIDSVAVRLSIRALSLDGAGLTADGESLLETMIASEFVPPRPFRLSVFSAGTPVTHLLKSMSPKSGLRAPTVTGVYRFMLHSDGTVSDVYIARISLVPGFDSAAVSAIQSAARLNAMPKTDGQAKEARIELRLTTDSLPGGRSLSLARFPRMTVVDASAKPDNPAPVYPEEEKRDGVEGDAVLRFIVDRTGEPIVETAMVVRGGTPGFVMAAMSVLPKLRFTPATISGCAVAQAVDYPFNFVLPKAGSGMMGEGQAARGVVRKD